MKHPLLLIFLVLFSLVSCSEEEETPILYAEDELYVHAKLDGLEYGYQYKLPEYREGMQGDMIFYQYNELGINSMVYLTMDDQVAIQVSQNCTNGPGKNSCLTLFMTMVNGIGKHTNPNVVGFFGVDGELYIRNYALDNEKSLDFEVVLAEYNPMKRTLKGSFKGMIEKRNQSGTYVPYALEGDFRVGTLRKL